MADVPAGFVPDEATAPAGFVPDTAPAQPATPPHGPTMLDRALSFAGGVAAGPLGAMVAPDVVKGLAKSALGTIEGGGKLVRAIPVVGPALDRLPSVTVPISTQPTNATQTLAKTAGDIGQFFLPETTVGKVKSALTTGHGVLDALIAAGADAAGAGAVGSAQTGSLSGGAKAAAATGAMSAAAPVISGGLTKLGERVESALVKPTPADMRDGFNVQKVFQQNVGGSLAQTYDKVQQKLNAGSQALKIALKLPKAGQGQVDLVGALADAASTLKKDAASTFGQNAAIDGAVSKLLGEIQPSLVNESPAAQSSGVVGLQTAQHIKQAVGDMGAWLHDPSGRTVVDPESKALETVANTYYDKLKTAIEDQSSGPVKAINKNLSDLMSIRRAVIRRIPIEQRANVLNLGDLLSLSHGTLGLAVANRVLRSGQFANAAVKAGASSVASNVLPELAGAATSEATQQ